MAFSTRSPWLVRLRPLPSLDAKVGKVKLKRSCGCFARAATARCTSASICSGVCLASMSKSMPINCGDA